MKKKDMSVRFSCNYFITTVFWDEDTCKLRGVYS